VCKDRSFFKSFVLAEDEKVLYMGKTSPIEVKGIGQVDLVFTSGQILTLNYVFYALEVRKTLVFDFLLNRFGFEQVYETDHFILSKGNVHEGKGYTCSDMFKLNVLNF